MAHSRTAVGGLGGRAGGSVRGAVTSVTPSCHVTRRRKGVTAATSTEGVRGFDERSTALGQGVSPVIEPLPGELRLMYYRPAGGLTGNTGRPMSHEEVLNSQTRWEQDLDERWRARELLKSAAASEEARRLAQERLRLSPLDPPPSMQWALRTRHPTAH